MIRTLFLTIKFILPLIFLFYSAVGYTQTSSVTPLHDDALPASSFSSSTRTLSTILGADGIASPNSVDLKTPGLRISKLGSNSLLGYVGIQEGDVIYRVNLIDIRTADDLLKACQVRNLNRLVFLIGRGPIKTSVALAFN